MKDEELLIKEVENMSYFDMFKLRRFAPVGSPYFMGKVGDAFMKRFAKLEKNIDPVERTRISKRIGWR